MAESFTDEEHEFLRHVRFGQLPERILPEDMVEAQETEPDKPMMPDTFDRDWHLRHSAG